MQDTRSAPNGEAATTIQSYQLRRNCTLHGDKDNSYVHGIISPVREFNDVTLVGLHVHVYRRKAIRFVAQSSLAHDWLLLSSTEPIVQVKLLPVTRDKVLCVRCTYKLPVRKCVSNKQLR